MSKLSEWLSMISHPNAPKPPSPLPEPRKPHKVPKHTVDPEKPEPESPVVTDEEIAAGNAAIRVVLDESGYGSFVSNAQSTSLATAVLLAGAKVRHPSVS